MDVSLPPFSFCHGPEEPRRKSQTLNFSDGYPEVRPLKKDKYARRFSNELVKADACDGVCGCDEDAFGPQPAWLKYDHQVLRFFAYFKEQVNERREENFRVRKCTIYYYLEDQTLQISEPRTDNSGMPQGQFLRRHRVLKRLTPTEPIGVADFQLGKDIEIYGHVYHIVSCDIFTRRYLLKHGYPIGEEEAIPGEPLTSYRESLEHKRVRHPKDFASKQFLENNGKVLRFFCVWDDRDNLYGDERPYIMNYFLEDDTLEIMEINERNAGKDPYPKLLRRCRLPKKVPEALLGAQMVAKKPKSSYYNARDFRVGSFIRVLNRDMLIHDVDDYTRGYYMENYNMSKEDLDAINVQEPGPVLARMEAPPHNGFGQPEDSYSHCIHLMPKTPWFDFDKWIKNDGKILTFAAKMVEDTVHKIFPTEKTRFFIVQYHLGDDTMSVFEPPVRNSGIVAGRYIQRQRAVFKPGSNKRYTPVDMYVGNRIQFYDHLFELIHADEWTLKYMEAHPRDFPKADFCAVIDKVNFMLKNMPESKVDKLHKSFPERTGIKSMDSSEPISELFRRAGIDLANHEIIAIDRHFGCNKDKVIEFLYNKVKEFLK